jgi:uncharacterized protein (DUF1015 family)
MRTRTTVVRPFRALHFDPARVDVADVVSPPFDVIEPRERERLLARSDYNVVRLILPGDGDEAHVHALICDWRAQGVLKLDPEPCFYLVEQDWLEADGTPRTRVGFIGLVRLEPYDAGVIRRHERTRPGPVSGRLRLLQATRAHLSPIFVLYRDPERRVEDLLLAGRARSEPEVDLVDDDGTRYRLWRVPSNVAEIADVVATRPLLIADGHHRYETALAYQGELRATGDDPACFMPMYLVNADGGGLAVYPTHRVVGGVAPAQKVALEGALAAHGLPVRRGPAAALALEAALLADPTASAAILLGGGRPGLLVDDPQGMLGADFAQERILAPALDLPRDVVAKTDRIRYVHRAADAGALVDDDPDRIAILLRAPTIDEIEEVVDRGDVMPQKSTYFAPKMLDGLVFYGMEDCR